MNNVGIIPELPVQLAVGLRRRRHKRITPVACNTLEV